MVDMFVPEVDLDGHARCAMYNVWRTFTPPPQDFPLAVCDAQSFTTDDEVVVTAITVERGAVDIVHDTVELPPQPGAPLVLLPRHDDRRGDRVQIR